MIAAVTLHGIVLLALVALVAYITGVVNGYDYGLKKGIEFMQEEMRRRLKMVNHPVTEESECPHE